MPFSIDLFKSVNSFQGCQWIDSHCHFDFRGFDSDREQHWQLLEAYGCRGLVIPGVKSSSWLDLIELCETNCGANPWFYTLGLHPYFLSEHQLSDVSYLKELCVKELGSKESYLGNLQRKSRLVGIGEIGLDFALPKDTHAAQIEYFTQQLLLAKALELPVILHVRKADDRVSAIIRREDFKHGGIVHAFTGSFQQGEAFIKLGFKLGIGGALSHPRAKKLRRTVAALPLGSMVLETDSPDMKPAFLQADRNTPLTILLLAQIVASLRKVSLDEVLFSSNNNLLEVLPHMSLEAKA